MNSVPTATNILALLDSSVTSRTLPYFDGYPWEVSVSTTGIAVTKAQPTQPIDPRITDRADYYVWCGANIAIHQPPEEYRGQVTGYAVAITPNIQGSFRPPPTTAPVDRWLELVRWSPGTTQGATGYSSSMDESLSGSIGMFGMAGTVSLNAGITLANSESRSSPDVDIASYTRSNSATFFFNLNAPTTLSATSSMEIYVQALFRIKGFSPKYLAYLDYSSEGQSTGTSGSIDPHTGLAHLTAADIAAWNAASNEQKENLLSLRAYSITQGIKLSCQIDFQTMLSSRSLPMAPVTVTCGTPTVVTTSDVWQSFLTNPAKAALPVANAVGNSSTVIGCLIWGDPNYQGPGSDENPTTMYDGQTIRSWNGEYVLSINPTTSAVAVTQVGTGQVVWSGPAWAPNGSFNILMTGIVPPAPTLAQKPSGQHLVHTTSTVVLTSTPVETASVPALNHPAITTSAPKPTFLPSPPQKIPPGPYKLVINQTGYNVLGSDGQKANTFGFLNPPAPFSPTDGNVKPGIPDKHPYRRLELAGNGALRFLDSSGTVIWASKYSPLTTSTPAGSDRKPVITNSMGNAVSTLGMMMGGTAEAIGEAIAAPVVRLGQSAVQQAENEAKQGAEIANQLGSEAKQEADKLVNEAKPVTDKIVGEIQQGLNQAGANLNNIGQDISHIFHA